MIMKSAVILFFTSGREWLGTAKHWVENEMEKHFKKPRNRYTGFRGNLSEDTQMFRNGIVHEDE